MRAFVITGPRQAAVADVASPEAAAGQVVVDVERAGVCSTDAEFFSGEMAYLQQGHTAYPMASGTSGAGPCPRRATASTGPGSAGGSPVTRCWAAAGAAEVHVLGLTPESAGFAAGLGVHGAWTAADLPPLPFDAVIDCSNSAALPALDLVEPGKRVVYVGLAVRPSVIDTRTMVLKDVTAVGILGGSHALAGAIEHYAAGSVDPRPLVAATVGLDEVGGVLAGSRPAGAGAGPKILIDPRLGRAG